MEQKFQKYCISGVASRVQNADSWNENFGYIDAGYFKDYEEEPVKTKLHIAEVILEALFNAGLHNTATQQLKTGIFCLARSELPTEITTDNISISKHLHKVIRNVVMERNVENPVLQAHIELISGTIDLAIIYGFCYITDPIWERTIDSEKDAVGAVVLQHSQLSMRNYCSIISNHNTHKLACTHEQLALSVDGGDDESCSWSITTLLSFIDTLRTMTYDTVGQLQNFSTKEIQFQSPEQSKPTDENLLPNLFFVSGRCLERVENLLEEVYCFGDDATRLLLANQEFKNSTYKGYVVGTSKERQMQCKQASEKRPPLWLIFTGTGDEGGNFSLMNIPAFKHSFLKSHSALLRKGINLLDLIAGGKNMSNGIESVMRTAYQIGVVDVFRSLEIEFDGIIGYSDGDYAAGYADRVLSREQSLLLALTSEHACTQSGLPPLKMATVRLSWAEAKVDCPTGVTPAIHNCQNQVTVTGFADAIERYIDSLAERGIPAIELNTYGYGSHTPLIELKRPHTLSQMKKILPNSIKKSSRWITQRTEDETNCDEIDCNYFVDIFCKPFFFHECLQKIQPNSIVLEIGRKPILQSFLAESLNSSMRLTTSTLAGDSVTHFLSTIGKLYINGYQPKINNIYAGQTLPIQICPCLPELAWNHNAALRRKLNEKQEQLLRICYTENVPSITEFLNTNGWELFRDKFEGSPLLKVFASLGKFHTVKFLIEHGAQIDWQDPKFGNSALHEAAWRGHLACVFLLCRKSTINLGNSAGKSALHLAVEANNPQCVKLLLASGANPNLQDNNGNTPLTLAERRKAENVLLLEAFKFSAKPFKYFEALQNWNVKNPDHDFYQVLENFVFSNGEKVAVVDGKTEFSFSAIFDKVCTLLSTMSNCKGSRTVVICIELCNDLLVAILASLCLPIRFIYLSPSTVSTSPEWLDYICNAVNSNIFITNSGHRDLFTKYQSATILDVDKLGRESRITRPLVAIANGLESLEHKTGCYMYNNACDGEELMLLDGNSLWRALVLMQEKFSWNGSKIVVGLKQVNFLVVKTLLSSLFSASTVTINGDALDILQSENLCTHFSDGEGLFGTNLLYKPHTKFVIAKSTKFSELIISTIGFDRNLSYYPMLSNEFGLYETELTTNGLVISSPFQMQILCSNGNPLEDGSVGWLVVRENTGKNKKSVNTGEIAIRTGNSCRLLSISTSKIIGKHIWKFDSKSKTATFKFQNKTIEENRNYKLEERLLNIFRSAFSNYEISLDDSFLCSYGNSFSAAMLLAKLREAFQLNISLKNLYDNPTVKQLANFLLQQGYNETNTEHFTEDSGQSNSGYNFLVKLDKKLSKTVLQSSLSQALEEYPYIAARYDPATNSYLKCSEPFNVRSFSVSCIEETYLDREVDDVLQSWAQNVGGNGPGYFFGMLVGYDDGSSKVFCSVSSRASNSKTSKKFVDTVLNISCKARILPFQLFEGGLRQNISEMEITNITTVSILQDIFPSSQLDFSELVCFNTKEAQFVLATFLYDVMCGTLNKTSVLIYCKNVAGEYYSAVFGCPALQNFSSFLAAVGQISWVAGQQQFVTDSRIVFLEDELFPTIMEKCVLLQSNSAYLQICRDPNGDLIVSYTSSNLNWGKYLHTFSPRVNGAATTTVLEHKLSFTNGPCFQCYGLQKCNVENALRFPKVLAHNRQLVVKWFGDLDERNIRLSWERAVCKFPALRLKFHISGDEIFQVIDKHSVLEFHYARGGVEVMKQLANYHRSNVSFKLNSQGLFNVCVVANPATSYCIFSFHNSILDSWSAFTILRSVENDYLGHNKSDVITQDKLYAQVQKRVKNSNTLFHQNVQNVKSVDENCDKVNGSPTIANLEQIKLISSAEFNLYFKKLQSIRNLGMCNVTFSSVALFAWYLTQQIEIKNNIVFSSISGTDFSINEFEDVAGLFMRIIPVEIPIEKLSSSSLVDGVKFVQNLIIETIDHRAFDVSSCENRHHHSFSSLFSYTYLPPLINGVFVPEEDLSFLSDFPLMISVTDSGNNISASIKYDSEKFDLESVKRMSQTFHKIISFISATPNCLIEQYLNLFKTPQDIACDTIPSSQFQLENLELLNDFKNSNDVVPGDRNSSSCPHSPCENALAKLWSTHLKIPLDSFGINDNFFQLGGDSILCLEIVSKLREIFQWNITVKDLFECKTISTIQRKFSNSSTFELEAIQGLLERKKKCSKIETNLCQEPKLVLDLAPISGIDETSVIGLPATAIQEGLLFHYISAPTGKQAYVIQSIIKYCHEMDESRLKSCWQQAVEAYPGLRVHFDWTDGVVQIIDGRNTSLDWRSIAIENLDDLEVVQIKDSSEQYSLDCSPLFRIYYIRTRDAQTVYCMLSGHHSIIDGYSASILLNNVHGAYEYNYMIPRDTAFVAAQRYIHAKHYSHKNYWLNLVNSIDNKMDLLGFLPPKSSKSQHHLGDIQTLVDPQVLVHYIKPNVLSQLRALIKQKGVTMASLLQFTWHQILRLYSVSKTTISGTVVSMRQVPIDGISQSVGLYINTLPLVVHHESDQFTFEGIQSIHADLVEMNIRSNVSLNSISKEGRLFDTLFTYNTTSPSTSSKILYKHMNDYVSNYFNYPLALVVDDFENSLRLCLNYDTGSLYVPSVNAALTCMELILSQISFRWNLPISSFELECHPSLNTKLLQWSGYNNVSCHNESMLKEIEKCATLSPNKIALVFQDKVISYGGLMNSVTKLQSKLVDSNISNRDFVAIFLDRSNEMVVSVLAIWQCGAAFVPIDPTSGDGRISYILNDTKPKLIISQASYNKRIVSILQGTELNTSLFEIEQNVVVFEHIFAKNKLENSASSSKISENEDLAFCTYTSGTTGEPKGVLETHSGIVSCMQQFLSICFDSQIPNSLFLTSFVFDVSVMEILMPLIGGGTLHVLSDSERLDPAYIGNYIEQNKINFGYFPPALLASLPKVKYRTLKALAFGGEACSPELLSYWSKQVKLIHMYGTTETTIFSTAHHVTQDASNVIGRPLADQTFYLLNDALRPVPTGALGILYIGGAGVTLGYLNKPTETQRAFINNPFGEGLLYRTGDLMRWTESGMLEYIGRSDLQVKIRGYRIDLTEIEAIASKADNIKEVAAKVVYRNPADIDSALLVAYYVPSETDFDEDALEAHLSFALPPYMVPSIFVRLDKLPVLLSGKVDRKSLPNPSFEKLEGGESVPPRNKDEAKILEIWSEVLPTKLKFGITDSFFKLGGDSILSIYIVGKANRLGFSFTVRDIFAYKTIKALVDSGKINVGTVISNFSSTQLLKSSPLAVTSDSFAANPLQRAFVFNYLRNGQGLDGFIFQTGWNLSFEVNPCWMKEAWSKALLTFPALRLRFSWEKEDILQHVDYNVEIRFTYIDVSHTENQHVPVQDIVSKDAAETFALNIGPLFRLKLVRKEIKSFLMIFTYHHIILDGWSIPILIKTVLDHYDKIANGVSISLREDKCYLKTQNFLQETSGHNFNFWEEQVQKLGEKNKLIGFSDRPLYKFDHNLDTVLYISAEVAIVLDKNLSSTIKEHAIRRELTINSIFLYVWHKVLQVFGTSDVTVVGTVVSGRNSPIEGIEASVGLYINTLPTIVDHNDFSETTVLEALRSLQADVTEISQHSNVDLSKIQSDAAKTFESIFAFENFPMPDICSKQNRSFEYVQLHSTILRYQEYPLVVFVWEKNGTIEIKFSYDSNGFERCTIENMSDTFLQICKQIVTILDEPIMKLSLVSKVTEQKLLALSESPYELPQNQIETLHGLLEYAASHFPDNIGLVFENISLSYVELDRRATAFSDVLEQHGVVHGSLVVCYLNRNENLVIAVLAIMKAGGTLVPVEIGEDKEKLITIIKHTGCKTLLTNREHVDCFTEVNFSEMLCYNQLSIMSNTSNTVSTNANTVSTNGNTTISGKEVAYCLYTSGTTGKPKGVLITHRSILNSVLAYELIFLGGSQVLAASFCSYTFDVFFHDIFAPMLHGSCVHLLSDQIRLNPHALAEYINLHNIQYLYLAAALLPSLPRRNYPSLKALSYGGESPNIEAATYWAERLKLYNSYGPTETTVAVTLKKVDVDNISELGRPFPNTSCHVLDKNLQIVPFLAVGELYISGVQLTEGYLNNPKKTNQVFMYAKINGVRTRLYKSGDLVRWNLRGNLEYIGRADCQVKIRGHRVDLSEIEAILSRQKFVRECVVTFPNKNIIGYVVVDEGFTTEMAMESIARKLPDYMRPAALVVLDSMPLTPNRKIDRAKLPSYEFKSTVIGLQKPKNELELCFCEICANILGLEVSSVGLNSNFFELGGNSFRAIQLVSRLRETRRINLSVKDVFEQKTIGALCSIVFKNIMENKIIEQDSTSFRKISAPLGSKYVEGVTLRAYITLKSVTEHRLLVQALSKLEMQYDILAFNINFFSNAQKMQFEFIDKDAENLCCFQRYNVESLSDKTIAQCLTSGEERFKAEAYRAICISAKGEELICISFGSIISNQSPKLVAVLVSKFIEYLETESFSLTENYEQFRKWLLLRERCGKVDRRYWNQLMLNYVLAKCSQNILNTLSTKVQSCFSKQISNCRFPKIYNHSKLAIMTALGMTLSFFSQEDIVALVIEDSRYNNESSTLSYPYLVAYPVLLCSSTCVKESLEFAKESYFTVPNAGIGFGYSGVDALPNIRIHFESVTYDSNEFVRYQPMSAGELSEGENLRLTFNVTTNQLSILGADQEFSDKLLESLASALEVFIDDSELLTMSDFPNFQPIVYCSCDNMTTSNKPIFFFPGGKSGAENYLGTVYPQLKTGNRDLVLFNNFSLHLKNFHPDKLKMVDLESITHQYFVHLKTSQPSGPYDLFGWCTGGLVVYELAKLLLMRGDTVANVIIVDSFFAVGKDVRRVMNDIVQTGGEVYDPIVLNYEPNSIPTDVIKNTNFILLKAESELPNDPISQFVTNNSQYNGLENLVPVENISVYLIPDHFSWISSKEHLLRTCDIIRTTMKID